MSRAVQDAIPPLATGIPGLTLNVGLPYVYLASGTVDANGDLVIVTPAPPVGSAGFPVYAQFATYDGFVVDASPGWDVTIQP